jgi:hypothetical protein
MKQYTYEQYVEMGKKIIGDMKCYQAQVAYYATKVCEIKHGGRVRSTTYTLTKYAADIGVHKKTLSEWVSVYRNVISKLDKEVSKITPKDWTVANRVQNLLNEEKKTIQHIMGTSGKKERGTRKDVSPKRVRDLFNKNYDSNTFQNDIYNWNNQIIFMKNKIVTRDLGEVSVGSLISLKENIDAISDMILRQLLKPSYQKVSQDVVAS